MRHNIYVDSNWIPMLLFFNCLSPHFLSLSASTPMNEVANLETLRLTQVIFRHGDRNPMKSYPTDPYRNVSRYWPAGFGQLTDKGKMQQYNLGRYLRHRYDTFISPNYVKTEIKVLSSDLDRTIMSAESNLAGFYQPLDPTSNWNPNLRWTPVPFRTIPKYQDNILIQKKPCSKYDKLLKNFENTEVFQEFLDPNQTILNILKTESGLGETASITDLTDVLDTLYVQQLNNLTLPEWAQNSTFSSSLLSLTGRYFALETWKRELSRLRIGPFLKVVIENIDRVIAADTANSKEEEPVEKMFMYSAHDKIIAEFMNALGIYNMIVPPYATALMMELHKDPDYEDFVLKIEYRNDTTKSPYSLEIPECGTPCFLNDFRKIADPLIPSNWDEECKDLSLPALKISQEGESNLSSIHASTVLWTFLLSSAILLTAFLFLVVRKVQNTSRENIGLLQKSSTDTENLKLCYETISS